jgi:tetratricopeptide (TPR) repeat protein
VARTAGRMVQLRQHEQARSLNGLGEMYLAIGEPGKAREQLMAAASLAAGIGIRHEHARAQKGLGLAHRAAGDNGHARRCLQQALAIYAGAGAPEASIVRRLLTDAKSATC